MRLITLLLAILCGFLGIWYDYQSLMYLAVLLTFLSFTDLFSTSIQRDLLRTSSWFGSLFRDGWSVLLFVSLACALVATWQVHTDQFNRSSIWIWLLGMLLVIIAASIHDRRKAQQRVMQDSVIARPSGESDTRIAATLRPDSALAARGVALRWELNDWALLLAATLVGFGLRLYRLNNNLPPMHGDEGEMGMLALLALHGPLSGISENPLPYFGAGFLDHPTLFHYVQAGAFFLFGENLTGLRTLSVIVGALCIPLVYALGWVGWGRAAAFVAAWLMAVSHLFIQYSRIALNNIETVFMTILVVLLLALGRERTEPLPLQTAGGHHGRRTPLLWYAAVGLVAGISQYFYYGSRFIPVLIIAATLFLWFERRVTLKQLAVMGLALLVAYLPLARFYAVHFSSFISRTRGVAVFTTEGIRHALGSQAVWPRDAMDLLDRQVEMNLDLFVRAGDASAFYMRELAAFDALTVLLFWLGLGIVLTRLSRYHDYMLFVWFGLGLLLAGILTNDPPNAPRLIVAAPAVFLFGGVFCQRMIDLLRQGMPRPHSVAVSLAGIAIAAITLVLNYNAYFVNYSRLAPAQTVITLADEMSARAEDAPSFLLGAPNLYVAYATLRFAARNAERYDAESVEQIVEAYTKAQDGKGLLAIALPHRIAELNTLRSQLPSGEWAERYDSVGRLMYASYYLAPASSE
jgi:4-amino-4-deoxy-L-arabinose transferase-like glycosyltransferase